MSNNSYYQKRQQQQGFFENPSFYFGLIAFFLWLSPLFAFNALAELNSLEESNTLVLNSFFLDENHLANDDVFFSQNSQFTKESPDLKIIQDNFVYGISTTRVLTTQALSEVLGESSLAAKKEVQDHTVEEGETMALIASEYGISITTLALANDLSAGASLKVGQVLTILPVDGLLHIVTSGDTVSELGRTYKAIADDIVSYNNLISEGDIFIGDVLVIPYGKLPPKSNPVSQVALPDSFFIMPVESGSKITNLKHFRNAWDLGNSCGSSVYAAASGVVQKVRFDYRYGNYITVLHSNNVVTYYGHLQVMFVKPGDKIIMGNRIATMGRTGTSATGCHLHFDVIGAQNPFSAYPLGAIITY